MNPICTATTVSGRPCKAHASQWPRGVDGNPQLCGRHLPVDLREIRDAGFAEEKRRRAERMDAREPECWSWDRQIPLDRIADQYDWSADHFMPRFQAGDVQALRIALAAWHGRRCAVCGFRDLRLIDDHDHDTGLIRGLLCRSCNGCEPHDDGLFGKYRERPPARILGISLHYWDHFHGWAEPRAMTPNRLDNHPAYALAAKLGERLRSEEPHDEPQDH
ncbi:endonuclease domain-containing protein [Streptomyces sp. NPDC001652]|uniref:endonuclease domain-containing protein n=1 Tax=Streptomyces sp. NPDC001652 TaxID=3154393 RepID=UPI00332E3DF1